MAPSQKRNFAYTASNNVSNINTKIIHQCLEIWALTKGIHPEAFARDSICINWESMFPKHLWKIYINATLSQICIFEFGRQYFLFIFLWILFYVFLYMFSSKTKNRQWILLIQSRPKKKEREKTEKEEETLGKNVDIWKTWWISWLMIFFSKSDQTIQNQIHKLHNFKLLTYI